MIICSNCQQLSEEPAAFCGYCGTKITSADQIVAPASTPLVDASPDGEMSITADSVVKAKIVLEELISKKIELAFDKEKVTEQAHQIRAKRTAELENLQTPFQGSENSGRFVKVLQSASRDAAQRNLEHELAPYQEQIRKIEEMQSELEQKISELSQAKQIPS